MVNCRAGCGYGMGGGRWGSVQLNQLVIAVQQALPKLSGIKQQQFVISHQPMVPLGSSATLDWPWLILAGITQASTMSCQAGCQLTDLGWPQLGWLGSAPCIFYIPLAG